MSLRSVDRVTVENWRNWQDESCVDGLVPGVVVLAGPNAIGKTGVWEAIVGGLLDRHWGTHTTRLRPVGTKGVIPRVQVEFTAGDSRYRVEKHFGTSRDKASFWEHHGGEWVLRDQGEEAYLLCRRAVLGSETAVPNRGGPEKALADTLMEVLLPPQGDLTSPAPAPEAVSMAITDREAATSATRLGRVLTAVTTEANGIWVGKRDRPKKGSALQSGEERWSETEAMIAPLKGKAERIGELVRDLANASEEAAGQPDAVEQAAQADQLQREAAEHRTRRETAKEQFDASDQAREEAQAALAERSDRTKAAAEATTGLTALRKDLETSQAEHRRAEDAHGVLEQRRQALNSNIKSHRDWAEFENRESELDQLKKTLEGITDRLGRFDTQERILAEQTAEAKAQKVPAKDEWTRLDELRDRLQEARGELNAGAWSVSGALPHELGLAVDGLEVEAGEVDLQATREVVITGGAGHVLHIKAPAQTAGEVERLTAELAEVLSRYQVSDQSELRRRYNYLEQEVKPAISKAKSRMKDALAGGTRSDLLRDQLDLGRKIEKMSGLAAPASKRPDGAPEEWKIRLEMLTADCEKVEQEFAAAGQRASVAGERAKQASQAVDTGEQEAQMTSGALDEHRERHGPDDGLSEAMMRAESRAKDLRGAWQGLDQARAMAETAKENRAGKLAGGLKEVLAARDRIGRFHAEIEALRREDPEGRLAALEAERAALLPHLRSARVHAEALRLLEQSLSAEKDRVTDVIGEPVRERMQRWVSYLLQDQSEVVVDEEGRPAVIRTPAGQEVPYEDQSFGTREQVSILHRLAVADLVAKEAGAGVVLMLDDPFGHTDRG
jgi:DNA repair exonuclease SbcCD ATPase subunit